MVNAYEMRLIRAKQNEYFRYRYTYMAVKLEYKCKLKNYAEAERLASAAFFTQYMKDDFSERSIIGSYYDTPYNDLANNEFELRVSRVYRMTIADLKQGRYDQDGFLNGNHWTCKFMGAYTVMLRLRERGAPHIELSAPLSPTITFNFKRRYTTLYMPDQIRAELSFESYPNKIYMGLELLYGSDAGFKLITEDFRNSMAAEIAALAVSENV